MRCIFGLVTPDAGQVRWDAQPISRDTRLRFGYMPEERGLYPKMKVSEQLAYFGELSGMSSSDASAAADHWLAEFTLADRADAKLEELSHGNQQRVQLGTALVHSPELLVLDEPFAGLDPIGVDSLSETMRGLADDGAAIVFSSHQLDLVEDVCQDVAIINEGRVVTSGDLEELKARSLQRRLEVVVDGEPWFPDLDGAQVIRGPGQPHSVVPRDSAVAELLAAANAAGAVDRFAFEPPTLTDLFREAVNT
jgi:ABC-2 type transport system ATP-binding protein